MTSSHPHPPRTVRSPLRRAAPSHVLPADPDDSGLPDAELLRRHVAGDPDAFGTLVGRHRDRLWAVALRTMRNPEDAADALQDAYISAFRRAGTFRGDAAVTTWLHRVVVNACLDRLRRMKVPGRRPAARGPGPGRGWARTHRPTRSRRRSSATSSAPPSPSSTPTSGPPSCSSTCRATRSRRRRPSWAAPPGTVKSRCARGRARLVPLLADLRAAERGALMAHPLELSYNWRTPAFVRHRRRRSSASAW